MARHDTQTLHFISQVIEIVFNIIIILIIIIIIITDVNIGSMPYMSSALLCIFGTFFRGFSD